MKNLASNALWPLTTVLSTLFSNMYVAMPLHLHIMYMSCHVFCLFLSDSPIMHPRDQYHPIWPEGNPLHFVILNREYPIHFMLKQNRLRAPPEDNVAHGAQKCASLKLESRPRISHSVEFYSITRNLRYHTRGVRMATRHRIAYSTNNPYTSKPLRELSRTTH